MVSTWQRRGQNSIKHQTEAKRRKGYTEAYGVSFKEGTSLNIAEHLVS